MEVEHAPHGVPLDRVQDGVARLESVYAPSEIAVSGVCGIYVHVQGGTVSEEPRLRPGRLVTGEI